MNYHRNFLAFNAITASVMLKKFLEKRRAQTVMGHKLKEPGTTWLAGFWAAVYFGCHFFFSPSCLILPSNGSQASVMDCGAIFNEFCL
jgi:hypothetical protein